MSAPHYPPAVKLVEVGPRDGLQNEPRFLDTATKVEFIRRLAESGLPVIEVASFVHPEAVPQLADAGGGVRTSETASRRPLHGAGP